MFHSRYTLCLVLLAVLAYTDADEHDVQHIGMRIFRRSLGDGSLILRATGLNVEDRRHPRGLRTKRSELEFEIDEAMVLRVAAMDESGCGSRLLCELHQEEPGQLNGTIARRLVQIFDGQQPPNFENLRTEPKAAFQYAAFVGANSAKNLKVCAQVFDRCPFNAKIILEVLNSRSAGFLAEESQTSSPPTAPTAPTAQTAPTVPTRNI